MNEHEFSRIIGMCSGCGNGMIEEGKGEECDSGSGCSNECKCDDGFSMNEPRNEDCQRRSGGKKNKTGLIVGCVIGIFGMVVIVGAIIGVCFVLHKQKQKRDTKV